jgi:hypothetical protein
MPTFLGLKSRAMQENQQEAGSKQNILLVVHSSGTLVNLYVYSASHPIITSVRTSNPVTDMRFSSVSLFRLIDSFSLDNNKAYS